VVQLEAKKGINRMDRIRRRQKEKGKREKRKQMEPPQLL
jgi:hypothetical protein